MSEKTENTSTDNQATGTGEAPQSQQKQEPGPVPYERFAEVNNRAKNAETELAKLQNAQKQQRDRELADQNKFKELYEQREQELNAERAKSLRLEVAARKGIPTDLIDRLRGSTAEELEQDADTLLSFINTKTETPRGPGVPPKTKDGKAPALNIETMSPEEIRQNKHKLWNQ
ncbi:MAG: hypothetical protein GFH27_549283n410 [Chloroflexi bacterium AL-W]|nr:hypothetical protein [Chloroflexi bacterium AL-N1]NOK64469.1 hypothetical protein [Chloroflexi bacterium AL-N10]NOK75711.1 hypothetical protein [Chloroflexi bacterium AL-N5]NOK80531.1 hypothetical protein [Chloroflexi bacterium AL-W]NOK87045.1 hypothetical protein [Chloroflexi bacterium AL-N15]